MGYWNLHERKIDGEDGDYRVNGTYQLYFYHFSGFSMESTQQISEHQNRWDFASRKDVRPLYEGYETAVKKYDYDHVSGLRSVYDNRHKARGAYAKILNLAKRRISFVLWKLIRVVEPNPEM